MAVDTIAYQSITSALQEKKVTLVAVSKTKPVEDLQALYALGQRAFGENYVQELVDKQAVLPADIRWHFIGHLQSNKVKYIAPFVHLVHGVDSYKLLKEINKQAEKNNRVINCLLQVHIAQEETKFGFNETELGEAMHQLQRETMQHIAVVGLMGMASFSEDRQKVQQEFAHLATLFNRYKTGNPAFNTLSMGMSSDYTMAIEAGSTMVRIGSLLFGARK